MAQNPIIPHLSLTKTHWRFKQYHVKLLALNKMLTTMKNRLIIELLQHKKSLFFEHTNQPNTTTLTQLNVSLGRNYLFVQTTAVRGTVGETCLKTMIIILFGDASGT